MMKQIKNYLCPKRKSSKRLHTDSETKYDRENFQFIVLESINNKPLTEISSFLIQKVLSKKITPKNAYMEYYL